MTTTKLEVEFSDDGERVLFWCVDLEKLRTIEIAFKRARFDTKLFIDGRSLLVFARTSRELSSLHAWRADWKVPVRT